MNTTNIIIVVVCIKYIQMSVHAHAHTRVCVCIIRYTKLCFIKIKVFLHIKKQMFINCLVNNFCLYKLFTK